MNSHDCFPQLCAMEVQSDYECIMHEHTMNVCILGLGNSMIVIHFHDSWSNTYNDNEYFSQL